MSSLTSRPAVHRPGPEGMQRERSSGLAVFATALRCVPYIWPDVWAQNSAKLAEDLPRMPALWAAAVLLCFFNPAPASI